MKIDGLVVEKTEYGADFDPIKDCTSKFEGPVEGDKRFRWADGRRSTAQPENEVSGGPEYELQDVCWSWTEHEEVSNYGHLDGRWYTEGRNGLPFKNVQDLVATLALGKVIEQDNGVLACSYTNPEYPDFKRINEKYFQLSIKKEKMSWVSSERFFRYVGPFHPGGQFRTDMLVSIAPLAGV